MKKNVLIVVHPDAACGAADRLLGDAAAPARDALALEIMTWEHDVIVLDGPDVHELEHYAMLGIAVDAAHTQPGRRVVREAAAHDGWEQRVCKRLMTDWPAETANLVITGAWRRADSQGAVDRLDRRLSPYARVSAKALVQP